MAGNACKPIPAPAAPGSAVLNVPVTETVNSSGNPTPSPVSSDELVVPPSARRFNVIATDVLGIKTAKDGVGIGDFLQLPAGKVYTFDCAGMNDPAGVFPNQISIDTAGLAYFWFDCETPAGA